jgi:CheY-like chemotaxis protein
VALTAYADAATRARALEKGFQAYLSKPVDTLELSSTITRCVSEARRALEARRPPS